MKLVVLMVCTCEYQTWSPHMDFPLQKTTYRVRFLLPWGVATYGMTSFNGIGFLSIIKNGDDKQKNHSEILESIYWQCAGTDMKKVWHLKVRQNKRMGCVGEGNGSGVRVCLHHK